MIKNLLLSAIMVSVPAAGSIAARPQFKTEIEPHFLSISSIKVPIVDGPNITGSLQVDLVLDAVDAAAAARLSEKATQLRAASVVAAVEFARLYATSLTPVNASQLSIDLTRALQQQSPDVARVLVVKVAARSV